ncbi:MAG: thiamine diphosphokinase [Balneolaceae bacterium]
MKTVILCDGRRPPADRIRAAVEQADLFIAADGGGNAAHELKLVPRIVIGDLDSYSVSPDPQTEVIQDNNQESNDLEKALNKALESGAKEVWVFGAIGQRLDHTLKNLSVLKQFNARFKSLRFVDRYGELFLLPARYQAQYPVGTVISLFPLSGKVSGITTRGLKYPLRDEALENGVRDGTSNETVSDRIEITHKKGDLLLFVATKQPVH